MNLLLDKLPTDYEGLKIETNFRSFILFELLMQDNNIDKKDKIILSLNIFYKEIPSDIEKAIKGILWFYTLGKSEEKENKSSKNNQKKNNKIYSFEHDDKYIYSAFLSQYNVDLQDIEYLHWWKFKSMFECLNDDNKICEIMGYRAINLNEIKDKEQKKKYKKLKQQWAIPDDRSLEEKENDFAEAFW